MKYHLRYFGDPVLRQHCDPVQEITEEIKQLAHFMINVFDNNKGIGLAAPQVGISIRMFVLRDYIVLPDGRWTYSSPKVFINPTIIWKGRETWKDTEGCLSFPGMQVGPIERPMHIRIEAIGLDGKHFVEDREGLNARVSLHENDHLNGVLHIDRLSPSVRKKIEPELQILKKKYS